MQRERLLSAVFSACAFSRRSVCRFGDTCTNNPAWSIRSRLLLYYLCAFRSHRTADHAARAADLRRSGYGDCSQLGLPQGSAHLPAERQEAAAAAAPGSRRGEPQPHRLPGVYTTLRKHFPLQGIIDFPRLPASFQVSCTTRSTGKKRTIPIIVRVSDINDNAPRFMNTPYEVTVPEVSKCYRWSPRPESGHFAACARSAFRRPKVARISPGRGAAGSSKPGAKRTITLEIDTSTLREIGFHPPRLGSSFSCRDRLVYLNGICISSEHLKYTYVVFGTYICCVIFSSALVR